MASILPYINGNDHHAPMADVFYGGGDGDSAEDDDTAVVVVAMQPKKLRGWRRQLPISTDLLSQVMQYLTPTQRRRPRLVCKEFNIAATRREIWRAHLRPMWGQGALTSRHLEYEPHQRWVQALMCWGPLPLGLAVDERNMIQQDLAEKILLRAWDYAVSVVSTSKDDLAPDRCFPVWRLMVLVISAYVLYCPNPEIRKDYDKRDFMMCDLTSSCTADMERPFSDGKEGFDPNDMKLRVWDSAKADAIEIATMQLWGKGVVRIALSYPGVNDKTILRTGWKKGNSKDELWTKKTLAEYRHYMMRGAMGAISALPQWHETRRWHTPSARIYQAELDASAAQEWDQEV